jgi:Ran GTPase-activating protein (RanGAP) involved in mRNA processing and transport
MVWGSTAKNGIDDILERLLQNDPRLTSLYLMRTRSFDEDAARSLGQALAENTVLEELHLSSHSVSSAQAKFLAVGLEKNRSVRYVSIGNSTFGDAAVVELCSCLKSCISLETLDLEKKGLTAASCKNLCEAILESTSIRKVMLSENTIGDGGLIDFMPCLPKLESLHIHACISSPDQWKLVASAVVEAFPKAGSLKTLELDRNAMDSEGAAAIGASLATLPGLEVLSLNGNTGIGPSGISALGLPRSLKRLDLGSTRATDDGVVSIAQRISSGKLPNLEYVNICGCNVHSHGLSELLLAWKSESDLDNEGGKKLIELDAGGNSLCDGADELFDNVKGCVNLQSLRLHGCSLGEAGARALVNVFSSSGTEQTLTQTGEGRVSSSNRVHELRDLDVSGNQIPEHAMLSILNALPSALRSVFPRLRTLIIAANPDVEGPAIAERVEELSTIGVLIMRAASDGNHR